MKTSLLLACTLALGTGMSAFGQASCTINPSNRWSHGANFGWMNWRPDSTNGAAIGEYVCSGFIHAANVGWINLGDGSPANGVRYANDSGADFGVNVSPAGDLSGLAWSANLGWINFTSSAPGQGPKFDLLTGRLSGHAWAANAGWISLSNASAHVQSERLAPATDSDGDGIPDAWELAQAGNLTQFNATSDSDGDGLSDLNEYRVGTLPLNRSSRFVTEIDRVSGVGPSPMIVNWEAVPGRVYRIQTRDGLNPADAWVDSGLLADPSRVSGVGPSPMRAVFGVGPSPMYELWAGGTLLDRVSGVGPSPMRVFRVEAWRPLEAR